MKSQLVPWFTNRGRTLCHSVLAALAKVLQPATPPHNSHSPQHPPTPLTRLRLPPNSTLLIVQHKVVQKGTLTMRDSEGAPVLVLSPDAQHHPATPADHTEFAPVSPTVPTHLKFQSIDNMHNTELR